MIKILILFFLFLNANLSFGVDVNEYIPKNVPKLAPTVYKEAVQNVPDMYPWYFFSLIEQESCITLTHSKCWNEKSQLKNSREQGVRHFSAYPRMGC